MSSCQTNSRIIITGASGWLGRVLAAKLIQDGAEVVGVSRSKPEAELSQYVANDDFLSSFALMPTDVIVHAAFCRKSIGAQLVESMHYSSQVFRKAAKANAALVNISSQSVYGTDRGMAANEESPLDPGYLYSLAKASTELLLEECAVNHSGFGYTSLRLASLMGASQGQSPVNVISKFIDRALDGEDLKVVGGSQMFSFLDVEDAADAIICLIDKPAKTWKPAYTITPDEQMNIMDMANIVASSVAQKTGKPPVKVNLETSDLALNAGGSNALAKEDFGWQPKTTFAQIVDKMVAYRMGLND